jgi:hypothetical protein
MARLGRRLCGKRGNVSKRKEGPAQSGGEDGKASKARKRAPGRRRKGTCLEDRPVLEPSAAGIDIGAREIFVAGASRPGRESGASIRHLKFSELREARYVKSAYKDVTDRTFNRELDRLGTLGFISVRRDEASKDWVLELDFRAIGRY